MLVRITKVCIDEGKYKAAMKNKNTHTTYIKLSSCQTTGCSRALPYEDATKALKL
jgi:hypothetical protein